MPEQAVSQKSVESAGLGRILLLQSALHAAPDEQHLAELVCHALSGLPAIAKVVVYINGGWCRSEGFGDIDVEACESFFQNAKNHSDRRGELAEHDNLDAIIFQSGANEYGGLAVLPHDDNEYAFYKPYISNTANLVALMLENRRQDRQLKELNKTLEKHVVQRTVALRLEEQRMRSIVQAMPALLCAFDEDGNIIFWNAECERVTGYTADEIIGIQQAMELLYPDPAYRQSVYERFEKQEGDFSNLEFQLTCKDGSERTIAWSNNSGSAPVVGWATWSVGIDVTERKQAELAVLSERDRAENYLDVAGVLLVVIDRDQTVSMINRKGCELLGYDEQEIVGRNWFDLFVPERDRQKIKQLFATAMNKGEISFEQYENPIVVKGGHEKLIAWENRVLRDIEGGILGVLSSGEDITAKRRWEDLIHNVAAGVSGDIGEAYTRSLAKYLGEALEVDYVLIGQWNVLEPDIAKTIAVYSHGELVENIEYTLEGTPCEKVISLEACVYERDVQKHFPKDRLLVEMGAESYVGIPLFDSNHQVIGHLVVLDTQPLEDTELITAVLHIFAARASAELERARYEAEREKLIEKLAVQNEEMERFVYTVSHDLKTPLVTIKGFAGMLQADVADERYDELDDSVNRINSSADRMHTLLQELLELSRIGRMANKAEVVSLKEIAEEAIDETRQDEQRQGVEFHITGELPDVIGDRVRLLELVQNIVDNAAKYASATPQGVVDIGVKSGKGHVGFDGVALPVIYIRDNGKGIDPKYHDRVFDLFYRLDAETEGTGVGLAISKRIVEYHGGEIWVESRGDGSGCEFCFTLAGAPEIVDGD